VRYFLKLRALDSLLQELDDGSVDQCPSGAKLTSFWTRMSESEKLLSKANSLKKARRFLEIYKLSLAKHNAQFVSPDLLFLATFGEFETGTMVAKMLVQCSTEARDHLQVDALVEMTTFKSVIHRQDINLVDFSEFLNDVCWENVDAAIAKSNFGNLVEPSVIKIASGINIWDGAAATEVDRNLYLTHFGALPSTSEMVERAVKNAKLCQETGKGERNVTAYGIAGDGLKEACADQLVTSTYVPRMEAKRIEQQRKHEEAGTKARSNDEYKEDLSRGPSCVRNTVNHALYLHKKVCGIRSSIGLAEYDFRFQRTLSMLTSMDEQGSTTRYTRTLATFGTAIANPNHVAGSRELEAGVTKTSDNKGEIPFFHLRSKTHVPALRWECYFRELGTEQELDQLGFRQLCLLIKNQTEEEWLDENRGQVVPDDLKKSFLPRSDADFSIVR
jgi:hypothetical protein